MNAHEHRKTLGGRPELLAPAGSEEALYAAVENGADAVYFGLAGPENFNARVRAKNIPLEKLEETVRFLRQRGVRSYVTLNTLVRSDELPEVESLLKQIASAGVDAVLVQDFGVARLAKRLCPSLELHASTQMSLTSRQSIEAAQSLGIRRVVLPRELSLEQIRSLRESCNVEIEVFVHGALCMSFSGQCYASLALGGRSANRGRCAQPCRMSYTLIDGDTDRPFANKNTSNESRRQILSPCDLAALPLLPDLINTGVHALKIEGRLKPPEYVAEVTRIYRQAIDRLSSESQTSKKITNDKDYAASIAEDMNRLELTFSRGFSTGWLEGVNPRRLVPGNITDHRGSALGTVVEMRRDAVVVRLSASVRRGDGVLFENEEFPEKSQGGRVYEIFQHRESVKESPAGSKVLLTFANDSIDPQYVLPGQSVRKTDDPRLQREIQRSLTSRQNTRDSGRNAVQNTEKKIPLNIFVEAVVGEPIRVEVRSENGISCRLQGDGPLETARKHPLSIDVLREQFGRLGETVFVLKKLEAKISGSPMVPLSVLGKLRREMVESLENADTVHDETSEADEIPPVVFGESLESLRQKEQSFPLSRPLSPAQVPVWHLLFRDVRYFEDRPMLQRIMKLGCRSFYVEPKTFDEFRLAFDAIRSVDAEAVAVLPRILKPGESGILERIAELKPDAVLARNLEEIVFFRNKNIPVIADFSLNVINDLAVAQLLDWGVERITPGWDLDDRQLEEFFERVPAQKIETIVLGRIPLFTMEHCLWRANRIEAGKPCRNLCRTKSLKIRDRRGAVHSVRSDMLCRNIIECSEPVNRKTISFDYRHLRIEWDERLGAMPEEILRERLETISEHDA